MVIIVKLWHKHKVRRMENKERTNIYLDKEQKRLLKDIAKQENCSASELLRQIINEYIHEYVKRIEEKKENREKILLYIQENTSDYLA